MVRDGCGQPGHRTLKFTLCLKWIDEWTDFLYAGANSGKLKVIQWFLGGCGQKMVVAI